MSYSKQETMIRVYSDLLRVLSYKNDLRHYSYAKWRLEVYRHVKRCVESGIQFSKDTFQMLTHYLHRDSFGFNSEMIVCIANNFSNVSLDAYITFRGAKCTMLHALVESQTIFLKRPLHQLLVDRKLKKILFFVV